MKHINQIYRFATVVLCFVLAVAICGCGSNDDKNSKKKTTSSASAPITDNSSNTDDEVVAAIPPVFGEITASGDVLPSDKTEKSIQQQSANLYSDINGFAEKEATELRSKILKSKNTADLYSVKGVTYYISAAGNDDNNGISPKTPFKTIDALESVELNKGDAVLFERGYVYRFKRTISVKSGITYGSYGKGNKPAIYGSPMNCAKVNWTPSKKKYVWQTSFSYEQACGVFINHGEVIGRLKGTGIGALSANGDIFHDSANGVLYFYCDKGNPTRIYDSIDVSPTMNVFRIGAGVSDVVIDNICIKYCSYGISGSGISNVSVTNCEFGYIGGMMGSAVRRGNAIEVYGGPCKNVHFNHNWLYQIFDSAITWQGNSAKDTVYENITFNDNLLEYNNGDFEFWEAKDVILNNFDISRNIMRFTSMGWGTRKDDGGIRGIEGCFKGDVSKMIINGRINITDNIIDCPSREIVSLHATVPQREVFATSGNKIFVKGSYRTTDEVLEYFPDETFVSGIIKATDLNSLVNAYKRFDSSASYRWE